MIKTEERKTANNIDKDLEPIVIEYYYEALKSSKEILEKLLYDTIQFDIALAVQEGTLNDIVSQSTRNVRKLVDNRLKNFNNLEITDMWQRIYSIPTIKDLKNQIDDMFLEVSEKYDMYLTRKVPTKNGFKVLEDIDLKSITEEEFDAFMDYLAEKKSDFDIAIDELKFLKEKANQYVKNAMSATGVDSAIANITPMYEKAKQFQTAASKSMKKEIKVLSEKAKSPISEEVVQNARIELANIVSASLKASGKRMTKNQLNHYIINNKQFQYVKDAKTYLEEVIATHNFNKEERTKFLKAINWKNIRRKLVSRQKIIDRKFSLLDKQFMHNGKVVTLRSMYTLNLNLNELKVLIKEAQKKPVVKSSKKKPLLVTYENKEYSTLTKEQQELLNKLDKLLMKAKKISRGKITLEEAKYFIHSKDFQFVTKASKMLEDFTEANKYTEEQTNQFKKLIDWKNKNKKLLTLQKAINRKFSICNKEFIRSNQIMTLRDYDLWNMSEKRFNRLCKLISKERNNIRKHIEKRNEKALFNIYFNGNKMLKTSKNKVSVRKIKLLKNELQRIKIPNMLIEQSLNDFSKRLDDFITNKDNRMNNSKSLLNRVETLINKITNNNPTLVSRGYRRKTMQVAINAFSGIIAATSLSIGIASFNSQARSKEQKAEKASCERYIDDSILLTNENIEKIQDSMVKPVRIDIKRQMVSSNQLRGELVAKKYELEAAKWVCNYYGVTMAELDKFTDTFINTHKTLGTGMTDKMTIYNYLYMLSCIPNEEKLRVIMETQNITRDELDTVLCTGTGEAWHCYFDGYATGSTNYLRTISEKWTPKGGLNNIYTQVTRPGQYSVYLEKTYLGYKEEIKNGSMRTQGIIDALYSQIPVHLFTSFEYSESNKYDFKYTLKGNCYGNPKTDFDASIVQNAASYFTEDYRPVRTLEKN